MIIAGLIIWYLIGFATILRVDWVVDKEIALKTVFLGLIGGIFRILIFLFATTTENDILELGNFKVTLFKKKD